tara:strand:- start:74 stop:580 length:507 start_codon:yes stop_codon:yes gene_type:complete
MEQHLLKSDRGVSTQEIDEIIYLVPEEERSVDLGNLKHYDHHSFYYYDFHGDEFRSSLMEDGLKKFANISPTDSVICDIGRGGGRVSAYLLPKETSTRSDDSTSLKRFVLARDFYDYFLNSQTKFLRPDIMSATLNEEEINFTLRQSGRPTSLYLVKKRTEQTKVSVR